MESNGSERFVQLQDWLGKHGGVVERLTDKGDDHIPHYPSRRDMKQPMLQLHVPSFLQLRSLDLSFMRARLPGQGVSTRSSARGRKGSSLTGPSSNTAGSTSGSGAPGESSNTVVLLPQLQELRLQHCYITEQLATQFLSTSTLTQLQWDDVIIYNTNWTKRTAPEQVLSALWQELQLLPKLSVLELGGRLTAADVTPLSSLQHLQRLGVSLFSNSAAAAVAAAAPPGLTALDLDLGSTIMGFGDHSAPSEVHLSALSQLQCFRGAGVRMQPSTLAAKTGLQELHLHWPKTSDRLHWISRELLSALQPLTQLRHLELKECWLNRVEPQPEQQGYGYQCFSALTASTQLTALILAESAVPPVPHVQFMLFTCMLCLVSVWHVCNIAPSRLVMLLA